MVTGFRNKVRTRQVIDRMSRKPEPIALFDLDGTLADFDGAMRRELVKLASPHEDPADIETHRENLPHMKARRHLVKSQPGFWRDLRTIENGFQIYDMARALGFRTHILSKGPRMIESAWSEKVEWCRRLVFESPIILAEDKGLVYGKVLVDDWPDYIERWLEWRPRGLVIAVAQPWNEGIDEKHPGRVIRYDGDRTQNKNIRTQLERIREECE